MLEIRLQTPPYVDATAPHNGPAAHAGNQPDTTQSNAPNAASGSTIPNHAQNSLTRRIPTKSLTAAPHAPPPPTPQLPPLPSPTPPQHHPQPNPPPRFIPTHPRPIPTPPTRSNSTSMAQKARPTNQTSPQGTTTPKPLPLRKPNSTLHHPYQLPRITLSLGKIATNTAAVQHSPPTTVSNTTTLPTPLQTTLTSRLPPPKSPPLMATQLPPTSTSPQPHPVNPTTNHPSRPLPKETTT